MTKFEVTQLIAGAESNKVYRFFTDKLFIPIILGLLALLWKMGWREWKQRNKRLDVIEEKLRDLEDAVNGGEQANGIQAEVHEIKEMLHKAESES